MTAAIEVRGLVKHYDTVEAVRGIDLTIEESEVFALLGPNGAGKTTTVEILEGHRRRTDGTVSVLGLDPERGGRDLRERIGIVLQSAGIEPELTVREALRTYAALYTRPRGVDEVIELVGLDDKADARIKHLSGGQQRRLDLGLGLIGDPELIFLDEPTTGFDPSARRRAWALVSSLRSLGRTILLTTHYMDEAQALADRVAVIAAGRILAEGPPGALTGPEGELSTTIRFRLPPDVGLEDLPGRFADAAVAVDGGVEVTTGQPTTMLHALTSWAMQRDLELEQLTVTRPNLEEVYLALTARAESDRG
ncbi:MAG TPA: ABC transporter ATP-binding protein [Nitriliruptorales bacterium]|nr:ABC transporter ATP-binding protein [Nitriliruptorales bacterium]